MLAERGIDCILRDGPPLGFEVRAIIARKLRRGQSRPDGRWHLDEVFVSSVQN
jgi:hypothetical protein